ncbi:ATP-binding protein [Niabella yanshanensis]|uniref:ATP-binding protein n=1 Tax=Niabella yanshanensis TaxID=577386 RepID=A0ABZ0W6R2_9BACT|nr:ATP-binding protein [Niabella yanshanensis]WQD38219.1 ATP-binding protein [Niabella yanshanensis]
MGIILHDVGDYFGSQELLFKALKILDEQNEQHHERIASAYNELGKNSRNLKNYQEAIHYYDLAIDFSTDTSFKLVRLNNKGATYKDEEQYDLAIKVYNSILNSDKNIPQEYARILSNFAYAKWLKDSSYNAAPEIWNAIRIWKNEKDDWGLSASYIHLTHYYRPTRPDSALFYAKKLYKITKNLNSPDEIKNALAMLIPVSTLGEVKEYFTKYRSLSDSIETARNKAKNQFATIRYETEKHKTDKLKLQKENAETKLRVVWQRVISIVLGIGAVIGFIWYRKRKQQAIREQQLQMSKKVHDKVANKVYRIMSEVEHKGLPEKNVLLYKLNTVYKQSRDISYNEPGKNNQDFQQSVSELLESFASNTVKVASVGNSQQIWEKMTPVAREELSITIEELMTNMKKHSSASNVVLKFMQKENIVEVLYTDDGIGLPPRTLYGNGLRNTETRIKDIGGRIIFDKTIPGLKVRIFIPIAK